MRVRGIALLGLLVCTALLITACDSGTPSGGPLQGPVPPALTSTPQSSPIAPSVVPTDVALPTLTAVARIAVATTPSSEYWERPEKLASAELDACTLLTEEEAEAATGLQLKRAESVDQSTPGAKCRYEADGTAVSLKVFAPIDEPQAARVWKGSYIAYTNMSSFMQYAPGVGDAAFIYTLRSNASDLMVQRFWYIVVKQGKIYYELLWLTDSQVPIAALTEMASKIVPRL